MENYICINGKKAELTEEQLKALGIEIPKASPFKRVKCNELYFVIDAMGNLRQYREGGDTSDYDLYRAANYCTDKSLMEQRALHETLNRLLWRYAMEHKAERVDKKVWTIHKCDSGVKVGWLHQAVCSVGECTFDTEEIAEAALKEIYEPFMKAHPEFKW